MRGMGKALAPTSMQLNRTNHVSAHNSDVNGGADCYALTNRAQLNDPNFSSIAELLKLHNYNGRGIMLQVEC